MIRALLLIFAPSGRWEAIKEAQPSVMRISLTALLPLVLLTAAAEAYLLMRLGIERGTINVKITQPAPELLARYELAQIFSTLLMVYLGSAALQKIGASFHRRHNYRECFTMLAYSITPLLLSRLLGAIPALNTWACYGIGAFFVLALFYRGIPLVLRPDPSNALGLFVSFSVLLLGSMALAHYLSRLVVEDRFLR
jgi:hypothetical protein